MPNTARKTLPAPSHPRFDADRPLNTALFDVTAGQIWPEGNGEHMSPACQLQWELYRHYNAERRPHVRAPYPAPVRVVMLVAAGAGSWAGIYYIARIVLQMAG